MPPYLHWITYKNLIALIFISRNCIFFANNLGFSLILIFIGGGGGNSMPPNLSSEHISGVKCIQFLSLVSTSVTRNR